MSKILVIGLDGATFDLIRPWAEEGKLPTFKKLMEEGVWGELESTIPPFSPASWSSFMTGKNPGKHGVLGFTQLIENSYNFRYINREFLYGEPFWKILNRHGYKTGILNVPFTYPPDKVDGFIIAGMLTPSKNSNFTFPEDLKSEEAFNKYIIDLSHMKNVRDYGALLRNIESMLESRTKMVDFLMKNFTVDCFVIVYVATDRVQHFFWKFMDHTHPQYNPKLAKRYGEAILNIYKRIDEAMLNIYKKLGEDSIIFVISDHGFGPLYKEIDLNKWLEKEGFLRFKSRKATPLRNSTTKLLKACIRISRKVLPNRMQYLIREKFPRIREGIAYHLSLSNIDWANTKAFSAGYGGNIYINKVGKYPCGTVDEKEYKNIVISIKEKLVKLKDPETGNQLVEKVYEKSELYHGEKLDLLPDLIVLWKNNAYRARLHYTEDVKDWISTPVRQEDMPFPHSGEHRTNGILICSGKNIKKGGQVSGAKIIDIAPTILYAFGLPIPTDMDGKVLVDIFEEDFLKRNPIKYEEIKTQKEKQIPKGYSEEDKEKIKERLRGLGYIE